MYMLASYLVMQAATARGIMTRMMAFSWTCHPNIKEDQAKIIKLLRKLTLLGLLQSLTTAGSMEINVRTRVTSGLMLGSTE